MRRARQEVDEASSNARVDASARLDLLHVFSRPRRLCGGIFKWFQRLFSFERRGNSMNIYENL